MQVGINIGNVTQEPERPPRFIPPTVKERTDTAPRPEGPPAVEEPVVTKPKRK